MSLGMPGNAVVVNFLMRFPILVPVAAAVGISTVALKPAEVVPPPPAIVQKAEVAVTPAVVPPSAPVPASAPTVKPAPVPLATICPTDEKTAKLSKKDKQELARRGCKIKG